MKTKLLFFFLLSAIFTNAQTNVSGAFFSNTNWTKAGSPYNVTGDVQVPAGVTLSIEPGVQIKFNGDYQILIKGYLMANGTKTSPIVFNSGSVAGKAMILFRSTNLSISQMSNLQFTGPKYALQLEDESEYSQSPTKLSGILNVKNIVLTNTAVHTKGYGTTASLVLDSATVSSTLIKGVYPRSEQITIKNSNVFNSTINSDSYNNGIIVENSTVSSSNFTLGCCGANFSILKSTVDNSTFTDYNDYYKVTIKDSKITNSPINLPGSDYGFIISNSTLSCSTGTYILKCKNLTMTSTEINGNNSATGIELFGGTNRIHKSNIKNTNTAIKINTNSTLTVDSTNFDYNSVYNIQNLSASNIFARNNWWGTTDATAIASKIYDYYDNINYGIVDFSTSLTSNSYTVTLQIGSNGYLKENNVSLGNGSTVSVAKGSTKTFTIIPNTGYEVATFLYNGTDVKSLIVNNQFTTEIINSNASITVTFKKIIYKISIQTGEAGVMNLNYYYGDTPTFDFTPSTGYKIQKVFYNGIDVTNNLIGNEYTLPPVTSNGTLVVNFVSLSTAVNSAENEFIKVYSSENNIIVQGVFESESVKLYDLNGQLLKAVQSQPNGVIFEVKRGAIYLIKANTKTFKVAL
ncbi:MAG: hypothetical protein PHR62_04645 [Paludibacter sp.]|nr:hypothetical protein [Paludibacter sp.]